MRGLGGSDGMARVDLHLHSRASGAATNFWVRGLGDEFGVRESYTPPEEAYRMAKRAGMDFVTLTDHETIAGALTLTHHPDFFVGEEVSVRFPEDESFADVLVYGVDAVIHEELQARRKNVHDLVDYLREAGIVHALAHPVYGMPGPLDRGAIERRLVLFGLWEFVNGSRPARQNRLAREIAESVGPAELRQMALRHGLVPPPHRRVSGAAGSDDHGGVYVGATHAVVPGARSKEEFLEALAAGEARAAGEDGSVGKVAHTAFRLAAEAMKSGEEDRADSDGRAGRVERRFSVPAALSAVLPEPLARRFGGGSRASEAKLLRYVPLLARLDEPGIRAALSSKYEDRVSGALREVGVGFPALDFLSSVGGFIDGHVFIAPYVAVHAYFGREGVKARELRRELGDLLPQHSATPRVGAFVDGMDEVHGVAAMYRAVERLAGEGEKFKVVRCVADGSESADDLEPIATLPVPLHEGLDLGVPSLLDVLEHVAEEDYDVLHVATPGPLGLAALVAGLVTGIPVVGAYHTEFGSYARALSGDAFVAEIVEVAAREFYERCSAVAVPSEAVALSLRNRGYRIRRFEVLKNGVDGDLFSPGKRDPALREVLGGGRTLLLYAGRVGRERGLEAMAKDYLRLRERRDDAQLVIAGDGPYRRELEALLGDAATFTGFLRGEDLARTFASCDVFVFPGATGAPGRAVAEAQASGLPAVVGGVGGPGESVVTGAGGFVVAPGEDLFARVESLLDDPGARREMGRAAREYAEGLRWEAVLDDLAGMHARISRSSGVSGHRESDLTIV